MQFSYRRDLVRRAMTRLRGACPVADRIGILYTVFCKDRQNSLSDLLAIPWRLRSAASRLLWARQLRGHRHRSPKNTKMTGATADCFSMRNAIPVTGIAPGGVHVS